MQSTPNTLYDRQEIETVQRKYRSINRLNQIGHGAFFANEGTMGHVSLSFLTHTLSGESVESVRNGWVLLGCEGLRYCMTGKGGKCIM